MDAGAIPAVTRTTNLRLRSAPLPEQGRPGQLCYSVAHSVARLSAAHPGPLEGLHTIRRVKAPGCAALTLTTLCCGRLSDAASDMEFFATTAFGSTAAGICAHKKNPATCFVAGLDDVAETQCVALMLLFDAICGGSSSSAGVPRNHCTISRGRRGREYR